ncbi:MAG: hypothetical protein LBR38_05975 [Synergistaceae bacterium]|jgi:hypothetical protein|nr:hypothetical protein [Synergistaceae bacterium]
MWDKITAEASGLPLVFYGNGGTAEAAFRCLESRGVDIAGVFVGDEYWTPGQTFHGVDVMPRSGIDAIAAKPGLERFNVLVTFQYDNFKFPNWRSLVLSLSTIPFINKVLVIDADPVFNDNADGVGTAAITAADPRLENTIILKFNGGGLADQFYQYAYVYDISKRHTGANIFLDVGSYMKGL